jgi:hypothetical protein
MLIDDLAMAVQRCRINGDVPQKTADKAVLALDSMYGTNFADYYYVQKENE